MNKKEKGICIICKKKTRTKIYLDYFMCEKCARKYALQMFNLYQICGEEGLIWGLELNKKRIS